MNAHEALDKDVRYYIYKSFEKTTQPPTSEKISKYFEIPISHAEESFQRLADAHQIALAPGGYAIWMAHPFSSVPTNYTTTIGSKKYFGN